MVKFYVWLIILMSKANICGWGLSFNFIFGVLMLKFKEIFKVKINIILGGQYMKLC
jgi:hypothetical protein